MFQSSEKNKGRYFMCDFMSSWIVTAPTQESKWEGYSRTRSSQQVLVQRSPWSIMKQSTVPRFIIATSVILGKLPIIEWKIKLVFAIQVFSFNQTNFSKCTSVSRWTMSLSSFGQPMPPSCAFFATFIVSSIGKNIVALINCQKKFQALVLKKRTVNINVKVKYCILLPGS